MLIATCLAVLRAQSKAPSRPHLAWVCESLAACRAEICPPEDRAAERLLARPVRQLPPPPASIDLQDFQDELADSVVEHLTAPELYVATDGSSRDNVGSFGITIHNARHSFAASDDAEDQTPYRMELLAIIYALKALTTASESSHSQTRRRCRRVFMLVDCQSAIAAVEGIGCFDYLLLLTEASRHRQQLAQLGVNVEFVWAPAHGRCSTWLPRHGLDPAFLRALNHAIDQAANASMLRRWEHSDRRAWEA